MDINIDAEKAALRKAADIVGGQAALAIAIGIEDRRRVWPWFNTDRRLPAEHCPAIEKATNGKVRCEELRPDVSWSFLRQSPAPTEAQDHATPEGQVSNA
jgi:DNA-binding transcriptional regulator YdaS (Cro superfamily)